MLDVHYRVEFWISWRDSNVLKSKFTVQPVATQGAGHSSVSGCVFYHSVLISRGGITMCFSSEGD